MPEFTPTPEQATILGHDPRRHGRVLAGPGTGKSATIVAFINRLLEADPTRRIKLLTFTRAATSELAKKVSSHPVAATTRPRTIHSFAVSVLLANDGAGHVPVPLRFGDSWEYRELIRPSLAKRAGVPQRRLDRLIQEMAANWESLITSEDSVITPSERARFLDAWHQHRRIYGYTLLQELPYALRSALRDHDDLVGLDYELLIVDEYQDLNACDLDILRRIAARGSIIFGAGDDLWLQKGGAGRYKTLPDGLSWFFCLYAFCNSKMRAPNHGLGYLCHRG